MKKVLCISPHLSTGGLPQYLVKKVELLRSEFDIYVVEYNDYTGGRLVVQKNRLKSVLANELITLSDDKLELLNIIKTLQPDIIHFEEIPELFCDDVVAKQIYAEDRIHSIYETSHDSSTDITKKRFFPDRFVLVSNFQKQLFEPLKIPIDVVDYPIEFSDNKMREQYRKDLELDETKKHILNVGLFTPRKNQKEFFEYARRLPQYQFHSVGNMADNFRYYWEPLLKDVPDNLKIWDERSDVYKFYEAMDLLLFTSRGSDKDKETMPLVLKEAVSANMPIALYNLPVYEGFFDQFNGIRYLDFDDKERNVEIINEILTNNIKILDNPKNIHTFYTLNGETDFSQFNYEGLGMNEAGQKYGYNAAMYWGTFIYNELNRGGIQIDADDVFVDLGANIGMSSRYAEWKGAGEIYSIEPDPKCAELLKKNVPNAEVLNLAVGRKSGHIELYHWPYNEVMEGPKYQIEVKNLKWLIDKIGKRIDYLKMDIEGFEVDIFDDMSEADLVKVSKLFIEHHRPDSFEMFCDKLNKLGFDITKEYGAGQNYVYATNRNVFNNKIKIEDVKISNTKYMKYKFNSNWNWDEQKLTYRSDMQIHHPIIVTVREYKTDAVLWSVEYESFPANSEHWIVPTPKASNDYSKSDEISGIKICIYKKDGQQIYENVFFKEFKPLPYIGTLSNTEPYYINFAEYFIHGKYDHFFEGRQYDNVVDVGASVGIFTSYIFYKKLSDNVIAVECHPKALEDLNRNFDINPNVKVIEKALSSDVNPINLTSFKGRTTTSTMIDNSDLDEGRRNSKEETFKCDSTTLEELIDELGYIDLLKVDIEAGEYEIFEKIDPKLFDKINNIFLECHIFNSSHIDRCKRLLKQLEENGYEIDTSLLDKHNTLHSKFTSECIYASRK